jgi:hypothetical protein
MKVSIAAIAEGYPLAQPERLAGALARWPLGVG